MLRRSIPIRYIERAIVRYALQYVDSYLVYIGRPASSGVCRVCSNTTARIVPSRQIRVYPTASTRRRDRWSISATTNASQQKSRQISSSATRKAFMTRGVDFGVIHLTPLPSAKLSGCPKSGIDRRNNKNEKKTKNIQTLRFCKPFIFFTINVITSPQSGGHVNVRLPPPSHTAASERSVARASHEKMKKKKHTPERDRPYHWRRSGCVPSSVATFRPRQSPDDRPPQTTTAQHVQH